MTLMYSQCSSTCDSSTLTSTSTCTTNSCVCNNSVVSTYASCLQCVANNYIGNDPDIIQPFLDGKQSSFSAFIDRHTKIFLLPELVEDCQDAGINVSKPPSITAGSHPTATIDFGDTPSGPTSTNGLPRSGGPDNGDDGPFNGDDNIDTGLAIGAVVGIAIAIPLGSALIFGLVGLLCANHMKNRRKQMVSGYYNTIPQNGY